MTKSELQLREVKSKEDIADADRRQKERSDKRSAKASFYGQSVRGLTGMLGKMNDPSWYKKLIGGIESNTAIPDFQVLGVQDGTLHRLGDPLVVEPSVIRINYAPVIGYQRDYQNGAAVVSYASGADPVNRALNRVGTQLEMRNSRVSSYSRDTIGRYLFVANDIACNICRLKMGLDVYKMADATKPFVARQIIRAIGFDYKDFKANISAYKSFYVSVANEFNESIPLPGDLSFVHRQLWMSNTIVKDSKGVYCTYIVFNRAIRFEFPTNGGLGVLKPDNYVSDKLPTGGFTFSIFSAAIRKTIHALVNGATWRPFIRDLRGGTQSRGWVKLPVDATVQTISFVDVDEVREQLHNMDVLPMTDAMNNSGGTYNGIIYKAFSVGGDAYEAVKQDALQGTTNTEQDGFFSSVTPGSMILSGTQTQVNAFWGDICNRLGPESDWKQFYKFAYPKILSGHKDVFTSDDALVFTRLKHFYAVTKKEITIASGGSAVYLEAPQSLNFTTAGTFHVAILRPVQYGTELVLSMQLINDFDDETTVSSNVYLTASDCVIAENDIYDGTSVFFTNEILVGDSSIPHIINYASPFLTMDWYPVTYVRSTSLNKYVLGELEHYTQLESSLFGKISEQCLESEFTLADSEYLKPLA